MKPIVPMSPRQKKVEIIDRCMRRAEKEIRYSAKRAVESYAEVWMVEPSVDLFVVACARNGISTGEMEILKKILKEERMM